MMPKPMGESRRGLRNFRSPRQLIGKNKPNSVNAELEKTAEFDWGRPAGLRFTFQPIDWLENPMRTTTAIALVAAGSILPAAIADDWDPTPPRDVYFVLDASGSISPATWTSEINLAKEIVLNDIPRLGTHRVGVLFFASGVTNVVPLTFVTEANAAAIANTIGTTARPAAASSYMKDAMKAVYDQFKVVSPWTIQKCCVFITDGVPNPINTQSPCTIKTLFDSQSIDCVVVGLGSGFSSQYVKCLVNNQIAAIASFATLDDAAESFVTSQFISCPPDLSNDRFVDDADFSQFLASYNELVVPPANPLADFNRDGVVDDADFLIFVKYYDGLVCPGYLITN